MMVITLIIYLPENSDSKNQTIFAESGIIEDNKIIFRKWINSIL